MGNFSYLCQCIGFVVVHWTLTEQQLDNWVNVCANNAGGKLFLEGKGVPQALKRKATFIGALESFPTTPRFATNAPDCYRVCYRPQTGGMT
jgi:hypothetical protein